MDTNNIGWLVIVVELEFHLRGDNINQEFQFWSKSNLIIFYP